MISLDELKKQVLATDLSVNNPKVQSIIESEIEKLVKCYEESRRDSSKFQFYEEIPDKINFGNGEYTPQQILEHVRAKDGIGVYILKKLDEAVQKEWLKNIKPNLVDMVNEKNVDTAAITGELRLTHKELLQKFISFEYDNYVRTGYQIELRKAYKQPASKPRKGFFERIWDYICLDD